MVLVVGYYVFFAALTVLFAATKGNLGHPRKSVLSTEPIQVATPCTTTVEPVPENPNEVAPTEVAPTEVATVETPHIAAEPTPTFMPTLYETVQPAPAPTHVPFPTALGASFGTTFGVRKPTRTYRRRPAPNRSASVLKAPHDKSKKRVQ